MLKSVSSITNAIGALNYKGTWNASTNTPALASGVGTKGDYYVVSVAGSTALDGISNWGVGDLATYNGSVWQRVEGGADLNGVNLSVTSVATFAAGTVSAPAITTTGDTNTGIFFPAADTIAFTENGVESLRLHPSGGISVGNTTDPGATNLSVNGTTNTATGSVSATSGVATTVYTMPTLGQGLYVAQAALTNQAPATFTAVSIITQGNGTSRATNIATATAMSISVSGLNIQATQSSGGTNPIAWTVFRIA